MNMVTETKHLDYGDKLVDFYNSIDWGWLFDFVREKYGVGMVQHPEAKMNKNGRIEVSWPENLKDKCGLLGKAYREVYLRTFSSLNFHDVTYDKGILDEYMKQPDFYKLNLSYADLNGTYSDAYLQIDISFYYKTYSGGYNYSDLFFAEYHNDTGWCHPHNSCLLSLRGIVGANQIAQWDTRYDAKGKKVLDDAE